MKNLLVSCTLFLAVSVFCTAQTKDAQYMIGGGFNAMYQNIPVFNSSFFGVSLFPSCGYFVTNRLVLGGQLNASFTSRTESTGENIFTAVGISPMARYFWADLVTPFVGFSQVSVGGRFGWQSDIRGSVLFRDGLQASISSGVAWFVAQNIGIEASLQYTYMGYVAPANFQALIGVQAYLNR
jgi:hypothetical protein